jgi:hypothetical protein
MVFDFENKQFNYTLITSSTVKMNIVLRLICGIIFRVIIQNLERFIGIFYKAASTSRVK